MASINLDPLSVDKPTAERNEEEKTVEQDRGAEWSFEAQVVELAKLSQPSQTGLAVSFILLAVS